MNLGIDRDKNLVYEGASCWGYPVWPTPIILPAAFVRTSESWPAAAFMGLGSTHQTIRLGSSTPIRRPREISLVDQRGVSSKNKSLIHMDTTI